MGGGANNGAANALREKSKLGSRGCRTRKPGRRQRDGHQHGLQMDVER